MTGDHVILVIVVILLSRATEARRHREFLIWVFASSELSLCWGSSVPLCLRGYVSVESLESQ